MTELDPTKASAAYQCGRLLATLDRIQRVAISPKATIVDKYYGTASSAPASVFGTLVHGAQNHMKTLRRDKPGAAVNLDRQMEEVMDSLTSFPTTLTLQDQAIFALGFYHQRAADRRAGTERARKREGAAETDSGGSDE